MLGGLDSYLRVRQANVDPRCDQEGFSIVQTIVRGKDVEVRWMIRWRFCLAVTPFAREDRSSLCLMPCERVNAEDISARVLGSMTKLKISVKKKGCTRRRLGGRYDKVNDTCCALISYARLSLGSIISKRTL